ncbi:MAG: DUF1638 domain-containing protein [Chloroflexota bacterium]|nr:DUF1638 domain-containing protein [Chloroflexota bacterium]
MQTNPKEDSRIIACSVFKPAIEYLNLRNKYPRLRVTYLPSNLHLYPQRLRTRLMKNISVAQRIGDDTICLYGDCFPCIDKVCEQHGVKKAVGVHCYEMLLGPSTFQRIMDETAGTYFVERDLVLNFNQFCVEPLELYDEEMRKCCFEHYKKLLYIRQPSDPDLVCKAREEADFLGLSLEIVDADYSYIERVLNDLILPE